MNTKQKAQKMHKFYCLMQLLQENLDELKVTNPKMIELKENIAEFCELLNNECADTYTIRKTTYFQGITNKIDTILRKEFNEKM